MAQVAAASHPPPHCVRTTGNHGNDNTCHFSRFHHHEPNAPTSLVDETWITRDRKRSQEITEGLLGPTSTDVGAFPDVEMPILPGLL